MKYDYVYRIILYFIATVWLINGLFCKVLNLVPRHQEIVENILSVQNGRLFTMLIGVSEIVMAIWIVSKIFPRLNAIVQIGIVLTMNIIEQLLAGEYLMWGKLNFLFALLFCCLVAYNEFVVRKKIVHSYPIKTTDV